MVLYFKFPNSNPGFQQSVAEEEQDFMVPQPDRPKAWLAPRPKCLGLGFLEGLSPFLVGPIVDDIHPV